MDTLTPNSKLEERMVFAATASNSPISGAFELLPTCNLHCRMCYMRASAAVCRPADIQPLSFWLRLAEELMEAGTLFLLLTGGEPYLYPDFEELYLRLREMGFILTINTNGTMITPERAQFLAANLPRRVNVTLYGTSRETYRRVTGNADAFDRTLAGIQNLLSAGVPVKMNVSLIPENVDELEEFYRIADSLGIPLEVNAYMYPATREPGEVYDPSIRLTPIAAAEADFLNDRIRYSEELLSRRVYQMAVTYQNLLDDPDGDLPGERELLPCRAARSSFWINWRGELSSCVFLDCGKIDLHEDSFASGWEQINQGRETCVLPTRCSGCRMRSFCLVCGAACYHENRDMSREPEYLCEMTREKLRLAWELVRSLETEKK